MKPDSATRLRVDGSLYYGRVRRGQPGSQGGVEAADAVDSAVEKTLNLGYRTGDIFQGRDGEKKVNTVAMGDAIIANL